jgi:hypothetical protein
VKATRLFLLLCSLAAAVLGAAWALRVSTVIAQGTTPVPSPPMQDEIGDEVQTVPRGTLPVFATEGERARLYRFATARGDVLGYMPCTCGCAQIGHTSNRSCYIKAEHDAGVTYTSHAAT